MADCVIWSNETHLLCCDATFRRPVFCVSDNNNQNAMEICEGICKGSINSGKKGNKFRYLKAEAKEEIRITWNSYNE